MTASRHSVKRTSNLVAAGLLFTVWLPGCSPYELRHENQWNAREQIWLSESSQLKVRSAQSRVYDTTDRRRLLEAIVSTLQDLDFKVEVLDDELGIVSGKKFVNIEEPFGTDPTYFFYRPDTILLLTRNYRTWGPFWHRSNLVRFTATIRPRGETQLMVRVNTQFYLHAVEDPAPYQTFFRTLEQALFVQGQTAE